MSATPGFSATIATGFPAAPLPEYDQLVAVIGCTHSGTYEPRKMGSSEELDDEYTSGPACRDAKHLVTRTGLGVILQRVEATTPGAYGTIDVTGFTGTAEPAVVSTTVPRDEGELYIEFVTGTTAVGTDGATYVMSDDNGRLGADETFRLGTASRITFADINAAIELDPPEAELVAFVVDARAMTLDHFAETPGVHGAADATSGVGIPGAPTNFATVKTCMIALLAAAKLHVVNLASSIHGGADNTALAALNAITLTINSTNQEVLAAALAYVDAMFGDGATTDDAHTLRTAGSVHGTEDLTNVITAPTPTTGTIEAGDIIRCGTTAPAWGNTQLATAVTALAQSDFQPSMILLSGRIIPSNMATIATALNTIQTNDNRCILVSQARKPNEETLAAWRAALPVEWANYLDYRVAVCAGDGLATFTDGTKTRQYARGFSTQAMRRLMEIDRFRTSWEYDLGVLADFTTVDDNGILIGHDEKKFPALKDAKFWTVYREKLQDGSRGTVLNHDLTRYQANDRVRTVRVNRITNRMVLEIAGVARGLQGKNYDVTRTGATTGTLSQKAIDAIKPKFEQPIQSGFRNDISDWRATDLVVIGQSVTVDPDSDSFACVVTINYTPKLPLGRVSATFAVRVGT